MSLNYQKLFKLILELEELLESAGNISSKARNLLQERRINDSYTTRELALEKFEYTIMVEDKIFWESRENYLKQIEMFLAGTIDGKEFSNQFTILRYENLSTARSRRAKLKTERDFQFTSKSIGFSKVISDLHSNLELFDSSLKDSESSIYGLSENALKDVIQKDILPKVRKYCDETLT